MLNAHAPSDEWLLMSATSALTFTNAFCAFCCSMLHGSGVLAYYPYETCPQSLNVMLRVCRVSVPLHGCWTIASKCVHVAVFNSVLWYMQVIVGTDCRIGCTSVSQEVWAFCPMQPTQRHTTFTTCSPNTTVLCISFIGTT